MDIDENEFEDLDGTINFEAFFQESYRTGCNIHALQLLVKDILMVLPQRYKNVLAKAKLACKRQHQSVKFTEEMKKTLPASCESRWNEQYRLLLAID